jgi:hypothetical protein
MSTSRSVFPAYLNGSDSTDSSTFTIERAVVAILLESGDGYEKDLRAPIVDLLYAALFSETCK